MKRDHAPLLVAISLILCPICAAQANPKLEKAATAVHVFQTHGIVTLGEMHGNKQEYEWLRSIITPTRQEASFGGRPYHYARRVSAYTH